MTVLKHVLMFRSSERGEGFLQGAVVRDKDREGFYIYRLERRAGSVHEGEKGGPKKSRWTRDLEDVNRMFDELVQAATKKGWVASAGSGTTGHPPAPPSVRAAPLVLAHGRAVVSVVF